MSQKIKSQYGTLSSKNDGYYILFFLIWPLIGFIFACTNFGNKISRIIILAFFALFGFTFYLNPAMDGQRRADSFKQIYSEPFENLYKNFDNLYEETLDFVEPVIMYTISRFTDFYGILFAVYALIFGSLMVYFFKKMYGHYNVNKNINALLFFILLVCVNPINNIGGFRMWTAAWIFSVGVMNYLHKQNFKYILFAAGSFFVHFSFFPAFCLFVVYILFKNLTKIYGIIAIITFFISELNIEKFKQLAAIFGTASETKIKAYTDEKYVEKVTQLASEFAWYLQFINDALKYFVLFTLLVVFLKTKGKFKSQLTANSYSFALLLLSFANISSLMPSGGRFYTVFYIFGISTILLYYVYEQTEKKINSINKYTWPIVGLYAIVAFRLFSDTASLYLIGPSFFIQNAFIENVSLESFLF